MRLMTPIVQFWHGCRQDQLGTNNAHAEDGHGAREVDGLVMQAGCCGRRHGMQATCQTGCGSARSVARSYAKTYAAVSLLFHPRVRRDEVL